MEFLNKIKEKISLKKIQKGIFIKKAESKAEENAGGLQFKVGTTSGMYTIARSEELAGIIEKLSYTLTRGAACIELAGDVPHEVNYTQGKELRHIAKSQGIDITFHGSLTVAMAIPETTEWNTAQEHIEKSIKSAIHAGAKYIDFHSCLREWLELFTYASSRMHIIMSDSEGNFIGELFKNNKELTKWFVNESKYRFWSAFGGAIVGQELGLKLETAMDEKMNNVIESNKNEIKKDYIGRFQSLILRDQQKLLMVINDLLEKNMISENEVEHDANGGIGITPELIQKIIPLVGNTNVFNEEFEENLIGLKRLPYHSKIGELTRMGIMTDKDIRGKIEFEREKKIKEAIEEKLIKYGDWYEKERTGATLEMAYYIIAHNMYIKEDPIWEKMVELYKDDLKEEKLGYQPYDPDREKNYDPEEDKTEGKSRLNWLERTILTIDNNPDKELIRTFKEFYYGVVASKFLQDHLIATFKWMKKDLPTIIGQEVEMTESIPSDIPKQKEELRSSIKDLIIAIENPDARDPSQAGRFLLWRPKQIFIAIDLLRKKIKENKGNDEELEKIKDYWDKTCMLIDFEHLATQGVDPLQELREMLKDPMTKDYGKIVKTVHAGVPSPLHSHKPIKEVDRMKVYQLLWEMKKAGLGSEIKTYLIFERGGFKEPYGSSVRTLKLFARLMIDNIDPDNVPETFYVIPKRQDLARQRAMIFEHAMDPIKGMLKIPEEDYAILGTGAMKGGKKPEDWLKERYK